MGTKWKEKPAFLPVLVQISNSSSYFVPTLFPPSSHSGPTLGFFFPLWPRFHPTFVPLLSSSSHFVGCWVLLPTLLPENGTRMGRKWGQSGRKNQSGTRMRKKAQTLLETMSSNPSKLFKPSLVARSASWNHPESLEQALQNISNHSKHPRNYP